jgi:TetR/AcrR family tetracycline transcriptional repressor
MGNGKHYSERSPKQARDRPPLDNTAIIETALEIVDEGGAEALSMRSLAQRMNSSTATRYRHFPNRSALIIGVVDRVLGEVELDPAAFQTSWRQACGRLARATFEALGRQVLPD